MSVQPTALRAKELERAKRDLEDIIFMASHDLKGPLRTIQGFCTIFEDEYADKIDEKGRKYLDIVRKAAERMNALIEDLLNLSRIGRKFEVKTVDLNELIDEIKSDLWARFRERGGEGEVVAEELPTISTQRVWMKGLFMNLIDNGLKFNRSEKPRVEVSYEEREREKRKGEGKEKEYLFKIKDNGIGIEEEYLSRIFNLSERLHPQEYEGTGFGLNICQKIVDKLGGNIRVSSKPAEGSTFFFTIPEK
uniref:histidine kinase n=1 Tax=Candidatus Methanophagaceae archaeon ANME-1 ERB6 TaxID=2759912 RepID=A0A7G9YXQ5_9EURY|nr:methanogenesis regulatory histidine kinase FilI [Methanosarcinales archaeon ANME-1 ERB6]